MSLRSSPFAAFVLASTSVALSPLVAEPAAAQSGLPPNVEASVVEIEPLVIDWRRDIHANPELGNREFRTAELVANHLRSLGMEVQTEVAHTGVIGLLRGGRPGPTVLLRADMDALPVTETLDLPYASKVTTTYNGQEVGVMHACGHDTHVAILMGAASVLAGMRDDLAGNVKFMFQPAEEGAPEGEEGGADLMIREGLLSDPEVDVAFALHVASQKEVGNLYYVHGGMFASADAFRIVVHGEQTHGGYPWNGTDPIAISAQIITALQTIVSREMKLIDAPSVVTVGKIEGGVRSNIIPERVTMDGTIRALDPEHRERIHERVRALVTGIAESMGGRADVTIPVGTGYPVTYNDPDLLRRVIPVLEGVAPGRTHEMRPVTGAEDFSFVAERVPSVYIRLGGRPADVAEEDAPPHHTPDFYIDDSGLGVGVRALVAMTIDYLREGAR
ncbi:MAG TPA: amidohydrolase [Longimicrobiales bacterium]|nr:amidohydrolase [Longimicrobiales bacterium]